MIEESAVCLVSGVALTLRVMVAVDHAPTMIAKIGRPMPRPSN